MKHVICNNYTEFLRYCELENLNAWDAIYVYSCSQLKNINIRDIVYFGSYWKSPAYRAKDYLNYLKSHITSRYESQKYHT